MSYQSEEQERYHLERRVTSDLDDRFRYLQEQINRLNSLTIETPSYFSPPNYLPNSHPEWSTAAYTGTTPGAVTPATAGDSNYTCYNWYRQPAVTTTLSTANTLKRSGHSTYAANEGANADIPDWDGVNGNIRMGSSSTLYDVAAPLTSDMVNPGQVYFVTMEVQNTAVSKPVGQQIYCGFWDNGTGDWIKGTAFTPTVSIYGVAGSRTLEYKILAETDSGEQVLSAAVSTTTAPATLSTSNHVRLSFSGAPGFTRYDIYRKDGSNYYRVGSIRNSIDLQFYDTVESGSTVVSVSGYPSVTEDSPAAYAISNTFIPGVSSSFRVHTFRIRVPTTYDRSTVTAGDQWFRFGLSEAVSGGDERSTIIRRIGVSEGYGSWTRSPKDLQVVNQPTGTSTSGPEPGFPIPTPPDRGGGGPGDCVTLDTMVETLNHLYEPIVRPISQIQKGMYLNCGAQALPVQKVREADVAAVLHITTEDGLELKCTPSHRLVRSQMDTIGEAARDIKVGDKVLTCINGKFARSIVKSIVEIPGPFTVKTVTLPSPHLFLTNGFVSHNLKSEEPVT